MRRTDNDLLDQVVEPDASPTDDLGPAAAQPRRRLNRRVAGAIAAAVVVGGGGVYVLASAPEPEPQTAVAPSPAQDADEEPVIGRGTDGFVSFTAHSHECTPKGSDAEGNAIPGMGMQCNVKVTVVNRGVEAVTLKSRLQLLTDDEGNVHEGIPGTVALELPIPPGGEVTGRWIWEPLAFDATLTSVTFHWSAESDGVVAPFPDA